MSSAAAFGQRGAGRAEHTPRFGQAHECRPDRTRKAVAESDGHRGKRGLFGFLGDGEDEFDIRLGSDYGRGHSVWLVVLLWLLLGGLGAHRLYLGHYRMMAAIALSNTALGIYAFSSIVTEGARLFSAGTLEGASSTAIAVVTGYVLWMLWVVIDGIYVIVRMAGAR